MGRQRQGGVGVGVGAGVETALALLHSLDTERCPGDPQCAANQAALRATLPRNPSLRPAGARAQTWWKGVIIDGDMHWSDSTDASKYGGQPSLA